MSIIYMFQLKFNCFVYSSSWVPYLNLFVYFLIYLFSSSSGNQNSAENHLTSIEGERRTCGEF